MAAVHAVSFRLAGLSELGLHIQLAAIPCWPIFGLVLVLTTRGRHLLEWFDLCLLTLSRGLLVLVVGGGGLNLLAAQGLSPAGIVQWQAADVLLADVVMALYFTRSAPALGVCRGPAWLLWLGALNGPFALAWWLVGGWLTRR